MRRLFVAVTNLAGVVLAALLLGACASQRSDRPASRSLPLATSKDRAPELSAQRLILSEGYSILYQDSASLSRSKLLVYFKVESDEFEGILTALSEFGVALKTDLERIDRDYPGVRLDLDPLPELEKRKRRSTGLDKLRENAPFVGKSGPEYERTFLISISNGLNQERHLAEEMVKEEPDPGLNKFLRGVQTRMDGLYAKTETLLRKAHYRTVPAN